ncbi:MAG TPA: metal-dependent hydrolase [Terriglobales bacterium]|jgi:L-ascorbate metabolism protein UlaG (beta-lactamase superfamily)|nr:metal-dependent hydrolase [Terriglobales bacterium]
MNSLKGTRITWLGHATVLIQTARGTNVLIDPFIAENPKYPKDFELPAKIQYILLTHGHGDHMSDAVPVATKHGSTVVAIYELAAYVGEKGVANTIGMNLGGTVQLDDVAATMVEAKHSAAAQDEHGTHYVGVATGFVLSIAEGPVLYHAGDTNVFGDMKLIAELYHPEVAMLPIGGHYTMGPKEAALATRLLSPKMVLPIHFGTFPPLKGMPDELAALVDKCVEVGRWMPGQTVS